MQNQLALIHGLNSLDVRQVLLPNDDHDPLRTLAAGGLAGATASVICYPLDLVRSPCFAIHIDGCVSVALH